jgi:dipeptidyl aminopeptidase/acylaminoacyl peptidase
MPKPKLFLPALVLAALLAFPVAAQATLAYTQVHHLGRPGRVGTFGGFESRLYVANDDGSEAQLAAKKATSPHVSPDGLSVAFLHEGAKHAQELQVVLAAGGAPRTLMVGFREPFYLAWSPDSSTIAALKGPELGKRKLVLINVLTGAQRVIAQGFFSGFSFSPDGSELVYAKAGKEKFPPRSDVFRLQFVPPGAVSVAAEKPVRITRDHNSSDPLWGPSNKIVFVKTVEGKKRKYGPKNELFLMNPQGKGVKRLTHTKVDPLLQGLFPTDWSADGKRLLAEFEGQDTSYAVTVNPQTGAQQPIRVLPAEHCPPRARCRSVPQSGVKLVGTALSSDGRTVLGFLGGFEPGPEHAVVTVPYGSGKPTVLAKNASEPSWSR